MRKLLILLTGLALASRVQSQDLHTELYRPQYHLSPEWGWMGDPNGMIFYNGKYHLLWWGHAISEDLVHWKEYSHFAMNGGGGFGYWSGCVVVDTANTSGFGTLTDTAMVAIYTMHYDNGIEKVGLSSSLNHVTFQFYPGNPVINTDQYNFRDPSVFWHEGTGRWVMAITRAVDRAIDFYASGDLLQWDYLSSFTGKGAKDQVWEVPDLFQLPVNGNTENLRWILSCGMGPNKMQYWIGEFDGTSFTLDPEDSHLTGKNIPGDLFEDFEGSTYGDWIVEGNAFGTGPAGGTLPDQQAVNGFIGNGLINTYRNGDGTTGKLSSPVFRIEKRYVNFLVGGGAGADRQIRILVDGETVAFATSLQNQEHLRWMGLDLAEWIGSDAHIEIVDEATGGWGHILLDQIVFSDVLYDTKIEHASWADWGTDFYAARSYRNYSKNPVNPYAWIGWMGNWSYANDVPTVPWKGNQSLPRSIGLEYDESGYRLIQQPLDALAEQRANPFSASDLEISGTTHIEEIQPEWNVFEMKVSFRVEKDQLFSIDLADDGLASKLSIGFDAARSQVFIDRTNLRNSFSNFSYLKKMNAPVRIPEDSIITLHIFMDQSSVELFTDDYGTVLSALAFSRPSDNAVSFHSEGPVTRILSLDYWDLNSIWGITPGMVNVHEGSGSPSEMLRIYPNPVNRGDRIRLKVEFEVSTETRLTLLDSTGRIVKEELIFGNAGLDTGALAPGMYYVNVTHGKESQAQKLIIR